MNVKVLIADDHASFREGLRSLFEKEQGIAIVGEAANGNEAVELARNLHPDVVLMDITMPGLNGIEATRRIVAQREATRVLAFSMESDRRFIVEVIEAGASGYVLKEVRFQELVTAVRAVARGENYFSPEIAELIIRDYLKRIPEGLPLTHNSLTPREREMLQLIADGRNTKEIAAQYDISIKTVEVHRHNIMNKLGLYSVAELTKYAVREGLTSLK
jgi:DNA-binding NarL/FixJ family response regulator